MEFVLETQYEDIPAEAVREAKRHFLDCVGAALAEAAQPRPRIVQNLLNDLDIEGECRIIGSERKASVDYAAFANGILSFTICYDDSGPSHPSVTIVPTLLSVGDWKHLNGKEILTAQILAYDVFQRLNSATREAWEMRKRGWHPTGFFGAVTSAAICAKLLGFNLDQSVQAVSIASTMGGGLSQSIGNMGMGLHAGTACRNGINAAGLAKNGFVCDRDPLTGRFGLLDALCGPGEYDAEALTRDFGKPFRVLEPGISIKPYPNCWAHHKVYDAVMELKQNNYIEPEQVEAIYVDLQTDKPTYRYTRPKTDLEARYSVGYGIALILLDGKLDLEQYEPDRIQAESTVRLLDKIVDTPAAGDEQQRITITMKDGRTYSDLRTWSKGHPHLGPLTEGELKAKYDRCASRTLGADRVRRTYEVISRLEELENISELMDLLVP